MLQRTPRRHRLPLATRPDRDACCNAPRDATDFPWRRGLIAMHVQRTTRRHRLPLATRTDRDACCNAPRDATDFPWRRGLIAMHVATHHETPPTSLGDED